MKETLILDVSGRPIDIISWKKAVKKQFEEKMILVRPYLKPDGNVSYISTVRKELSIPRPAILMLLEYHKGSYEKKLRLTRSNILFRDNFICQYTGRKLSKSEANIDHVVPKCKGGKNVWTNVVTCCNKINSLKGNLSVTEFERRHGYKLLSNPKTPVRIRLMLNKVFLSGNEIWQDYCKEMV